MKNVFKLLTAGLLFCCFLSSSLEAANPSPVKLSLVRGAREQTHVHAGLVLTIPEGWHVYAPTPQGQEAAGFEPTLTDAQSSNLKKMDVLWPASHKTEAQGQTAYVYEGETLIPLSLIPQDMRTPLTLTLKVAFLACGTMCVPVQETLSLTLAPGDTVDPLFVPQEDDEELSLLALLAIAFLGGLILNFMPCVLPVLSLKVMALIKHSKKTHNDHVKAGFLITGLGIMASFLCLAWLTVALKSSGEAFGWGIQFQNPHFLLFIFLVLVAFSGSLWGVFEIDLPAGWGTWLVTHEGRGKMKDFLSGAFATLLATPCSAPFVGTALSFALARTALDIFLVFSFLGFGFAFPYFLIAFLPSAWIRLPQPGAWMMRMQKILGIILTVTALWIGWLLSHHLPWWGIGVSTFLALSALSLFWIKHHKKPDLKAWLFAAPLFLSAWALSWIVPHDISSPKDASSSFWKSFDQDQIPSLVQAGKVVIVNATADWCVTCGVNKNLVLNAASVQALLSQSHVVGMEADWTKQDPQITKFLQAYERYGIPFTIIFGPYAPQGIVLPEILTIGGVEEAFKKAGGK